MHIFSDEDPILPFIAFLIACAGSRPGVYAKVSKLQLQLRTTKLIFKAPKYENMHLNKIHFTKRFLLFVELVFV